MVAIQTDDYGNGVASRIHSALFWEAVAARIAKWRWVMRLTVANEDEALEGAPPP